MSREIYPKMECLNCKHVVDIAEDFRGYDVITCECDSCNFEEIEA